MNIKHAIGERFQRHFNTCQICATDYNRYERRPVIVCTMHHTLCKICSEDLRLAGKCPFCRQDILFQRIVVNNYINELLPFDAHRPQGRQYIAVDVTDDGEDHRRVFNIMSKQYIQDNKFQFAMLVLQVPFMVFNLYFSVFVSGCECLDNWRVFPFLVVRPWFLGAGLVEALIVMQFMVILVLHFCQLVSEECVERLEIWLGMILYTKSLLWLAAEIVLYFVVISPLCGGLIASYGEVLTLIHAAPFVYLCCMASFCRRL